MLKVLKAVCVLFLFWVVLSYIEVVAVGFNTDKNPNPINAIYIISQMSRSGK